MSAYVSTFCSLKHLVQDVHSLFVALLLKEVHIWLIVDAKNINMFTPLNQNPITSSHIPSGLTFNGYIKCNNVLMARAIISSIIRNTFLVGGLSYNIIGHCYLLMDK